MGTSNGQEVANFIPETWVSCLESWITLMKQNSFEFCASENGNVLLVIKDKKYFNVDLN